MFDFIKIFILVSVTILCMANRTFATTIDSIQILPQDGSFNVVIDSPHNIKATTRTHGDKMVLTLKNTQPAENFSIKYDVSNLENVIIKPTKKDTKIIIKSKTNFMPEKKNPTGLLITAAILLLIFTALKPKRKPSKTATTAKKYYTHKLNTISKPHTKTVDEQIKIAA